MGNSFTEFRGHGFWANDARLEIWLSLLVDTLDTWDAAQEWIVQLRDAWWIQSTVGFMGCTTPVSTKSLEVVRKGGACCWPSLVEQPKASNSPTWYRHHDWIDSVSAATVSGTATTSPTL